MSVSEFNINGRLAVFLLPDASRTGAPMAMLHLLRWIKAQGELQFRIVMFQDGPLVPEFSALAQTVTLTDIGIGQSSLLRRIGRTRLLGSGLKRLWHRVVGRGAVGQPCVIYANTVGSSRLLRQLAPAGVPVIVHVHELEHAIQIAAGPEGMAAIKSRAQRYFAASETVRQNLIANHGIDQSTIEVMPAFIPIDDSLLRQSARHRESMRRELGIPPEAIVVGGCGVASWRKGTDLFVDMASSAREAFTRRPIHFVWVGKVCADDFTHSVMRRMDSMDLSKVCHFVGERVRPMETFCGFDVFALPSREEPMALVALEAASLGIPIICFANAGGIPDFVGDECGRVVAPMTGESMAQAVVELVSSPALCCSLGQRAGEKVRGLHNLERVAPRILKRIKETASMSLPVTAG